MADVSGKIYECFTEYLLRRIGWSPGPGTGAKEFLCGRTVPARCHTSTDICAHAEECSAFSKEHKLPYGPWYDPDFFLTDGDTPYGCIHVTHWSNAPDSHRKFWRTAEDHFQYKTFFGRSFTSINLVFEALSVDGDPRLVQDSNELVSLHGWKPATGSMHATSYDASVLFPICYAPIQAFVAKLPDPLPRMNANTRRAFQNDQWDELVAADSSILAQVQYCEDLMQEAVSIQPHPRYPQTSIEQLQNECWRGRQAAVGSRTTNSRYRKGIQHSFIIRELISEYWGDRVDADETMWRILTTTPRFPTNNFRTLLGLSGKTTDLELNAWRDLLATIPVKMVKRVPVALLDATAGIGEMIAWDPDTSTFVQSVRALATDDLAAFRQHIDALFDEYRKAYGMDSVIADLTYPKRVEDKVRFVQDRFLGLELDNFIDALVPEMISPYSTPGHQVVASDVHNWPIDILLTIFDLGSMQHIATRLPQAFKSATGESLRPYAFMGDFNRFAGHLIAGVSVGQFFSKKCQLDEAGFYETIWPLFAECLWHAFQGIEPLSFEKSCENYRKKKAMRIISSPDLEPIKFLFRSSLPDMEPGPTLRGAFNQLSTERGWSRAALTTKASGLDPTSGAIIQTQTVVGAKNIDHKVKELSSRIRSMHLKLADDETFVPEPDPGVHYLVVDGDWPIESKINLYEAGFSGIFEIGELDRLSAALEELGQQP